MKDNSEFEYHGDSYETPYFEGWYYKVTTEGIAFALIVGISKNEYENHAFIQTIDTLTRKTYYYRYSMKDVTIAYTPFSIAIKGNTFMKHRIQLDLPNMQADLSMYEFSDLNTTAYSPTIMGPFSYYKRMQCVHSIVSLQHYVRGTLNCDHQDIQIQGIGYMEKDRGVSFPKEYIWTQSNSCEIKNSCFFLSIAHIPILNTSFTGCICVLMINQKQYHFATYYGVRVKTMDVYEYQNHKEVHIELQQFSYQLKITIKQYQAYPLIAPKDGVMEPKVFESLDSEIFVKLYHHGKELHDLHFVQAGSEIRI